MAVLKGKDQSDPTLLLQTISALLGGFVIKRYKDKIVLSAPVKKRRKKPTPAQKHRQETMKLAVQFARRINGDPAQRAAWKKRAKGFSNVYQAAIAWYMKNED